MKQTSILVTWIGLGLLTAALAFGLFPFLWFAQIEPPFILIQAYPWVARVGLLLTAIGLASRARAGGVDLRRLYSASVLILGQAVVLTLITCLLGSTLFWMVAFLFAPTEPLPFLTLLAYAPAIVGPTALSVWSLILFWTAYFRPGPGRLLLGTAFLSLGFGLAAFPKVQAFLLFPTGIVSGTIVAWVHHRYFRWWGRFFEANAFRSSRERTAPLLALVLVFLVFFLVRPLQHTILGGIVSDSPHLIKLRELHERIRTAVLASPERPTRPVESEGSNDFAFGPDVTAERLVDEFCESWANEIGPIRVMTEEHDRVFPEGEKPAFRLLIDPVDGTRVFLRDLRSAWTLSALAAETEGKEPSLLDVEVALQTEIPTSKQAVGETLFTDKEGNPTIEQWDVKTGETISSKPLRVPAQYDPDHTFLVFSKFFPEGKGLLAWMEESILDNVQTADADGRSFFFDDQYLSTGGQLYCLATGKYSMVAELRPLLYEILRRREKRTGLSCHPYDIASVKIAVDAGVRFTNHDGNPFDPPMNNVDEIGFIAYATDEIKDLLEPEVDEILSMYRSG